MEKTQELSPSQQSKLIHIGYMTFKDIDEAKTLCRLMVEKKLIACANILPAHTAVYEWQNKIEQSQEVGAIIKTTATQIPSIATLLKEHHSYDVPAFTSWPATTGSDDFLNWIQQQTSKVQTMETP